MYVDAQVATAISTATSAATSIVSSSTTATSTAPTTTFNNDSNYSWLTIVVEIALKTPILIQMKGKTFGGGIQSGRRRSTLASFSLDTEGRRAFSTENVLQWAESMRSTHGPRITRNADEDINCTPTQRADSSRLRHDSRIYVLIGLLCTATGADKTGWQACIDTRARVCGECVQCAFRSVDFRSDPTARATRRGSLSSG